MDVKNRSIKTVSRDSDAINAFRLSTRQTQIAQLAATGLSNREIASDLNLTEQIVKNALHSVFNRLGVWNRVELANLFLRDEGQCRELGLSKIEAERLSVVEECKILDSNAEGMFDELANIAATVFQVPIALVAFADPTRIFKSNTGLNADEVPREVTICRHAIQQSNVLVLSDRFKDPHFFRNPALLEQAGIQFYAVAPILKNGYVLGVVCVVGRVPREFSSSQLVVLQSLLKLATAMIDLRLKLSRPAGAWPPSQRDAG